ncbi:MAG: WG repeat-containing protein [Oscillatoriales cyanobacterium SM2_3_0]|nr:WG repeat-containing protein [Oscillatoriales cyanobacterium SM2_3_0]
MQAIIVLAAYLKSATPAQPENLLYRYFDDAGEIPTYAKPLTAAATTRGLIVNHPEVRRFHPNRSATRAEVSAFLGEALGFHELPRSVALAGADRRVFAIAPKFVAVDSFGAGLAMVREENSAHYFINSSGQIGFPKTTGVFLLGDRFSEGLIAVGHSSQGTAGYMDRTEKTFIPLEFLRDQPYRDLGYHFGDFSEGLARIFATGSAGIGYQSKTGYINKAGQWVIQPQFDQAGDFHQQRAWISQTNVDRWGYGYIDSTGNQIVEPRFLEVRNFSNDRAWVNSDWQWGCVNLTGDWVIQPRFLEVRDFSNDRAWVKFEEKWGCINSAGDWVIQPQFQDVGEFSQDLAPARLSLESKWGYINRSGAWVIQPQFEMAGGFSDGWALVSQSEQRMFIDSAGQVGLRIDPAIAEVKPFSEGLAAVGFRISYEPDQPNFRWGYINKQGQLVIQPQVLANAASFVEGFAPVQLDDTWILEGRGCDGMGGPGEWVWVLTGGKWGYLANPLKSGN